jgi:hypothetical protein
VTGGVHRCSLRNACGVSCRVRDEGARPVSVKAPASPQDVARIGGVECGFPTSARCPFVAQRWRRPGRAELGVTRVRHQPGGWPAHLSTSAARRHARSVDLGTNRYGASIFAFTPSMSELRSLGVMERVRPVRCDLLITVSQVTNMPQRKLISIRYLAAFKGYANDPGWPSRALLIPNGLRSHGSAKRVPSTHRIRLGPRRQRHVLPV